MTTANDSLGLGTKKRSREKVRMKSPGPKKAESI